MTLKFNWRNITTRLIMLGITLVVIASAGRIYLLGNYLQQDLTDQRSAELMLLANYVAQDIDHDLIDRHDLLARVASKLTPQILSDRAQLETWLNEQQQISGQFSQGLLALDMSGSPLSGNLDLMGPKDSNLAQSDYFLQASKGEFAIGTAFIGKTSGVAVLPMALPIRTQSGHISGVLVGVSSITSRNFLNALQAIKIGKTGGLVLVSPRDKLFLASSDHGFSLHPTPAEGLHPQHDKAMKGFRGTGIDSNQRGIEELAAIASVPTSGWFVVARLPTEEAFAPVARLRRYIVSNTFGMMLVFILVLIFVLRYLLRPLRSAAEHADRMTKGDLPLEPLPVVRDDEVGHLTMAFNRVLSKLMESRVEMEHMAHHDKLTGLPNRQLLSDRMSSAFARAQRTQCQVAVLFMDLDGFKPINDRLGHEAGDIALREIANRLLTCLRSVDTVARVGGDEFVVLLPDLEGDARAGTEQVASKCLELFVPPVIIAGQSCQLGVSIGMALGQGSSTADELLLAADQAMYLAKKAGRGRFCWPDPSQ